MDAIGRRVHEGADRLLALVRDLVRVESPSEDVAALRRCADEVSRACAWAGAAVTRADADGAPLPHVVARWPGSGPPVMLVGHFDTVWPLGQSERQPMVERDGRLYGPGVYDMKAGLAIGIVAAQAVGEIVPAGRRPRVTLVATADEEVGSGTSRGLIESLARQSAAVLVLEPATASGAVKTSRKGVGEFTVQVRGVPAHAGVDPSTGASAIHALAQIVLEALALADPAAGLTVNVGTIGGGSRSNVVAERAEARVDVRISRREDAPRIEAGLRSLRAADPRVAVTVSGAVTRPPMERTAGVERLFVLAREVAASHGWTLEEGSTGGGSDGNFTAALGVPTLDGLGAVGDGAHALDEHVVIKDLPVRCALVAGLLARLGDNGVQELTTP